jgi:hypothetical protein
LIYPARRIATLWEDASPAPGGLARLLGATRAAVLIDLAAPRSTTEGSWPRSRCICGSAGHMEATSLQLRIV